MASPKRRISKRHLVIRSSPTRAACGLRNPNLWTHNPAEVTCMACRKSPHMADLEVVQPPRP